MNRSNESLSRIGLAALAALAAAALAACSSGSGGSSVGSDDSVAPTARPQILNGNGSSTFREGAEVFITGKESEDRGGPVLGWKWRQTAGPSVQLVERSSNTVSFTAPDVAASTQLKFELTVEDSSAVTGSATLDVTVVPAQDSNKFLTLDVRGTRKDTFDTVRVVAALAERASTGTTAKPFSLSAIAYLVYPPRTSPTAVCTIDATAFAGPLPTSTLSGCLIEQLENLTPTAAGAPAGTVGLAGEWPAGVTVGSPPVGKTAEQARIDEYWNPRFDLPVPRLDVGEFNQRFVDANARSRMLDQVNASNAKVVIKLALTAPANQNDAALILTTAAGTPIPLTTGTTPATLVTNGGSGLPVAAAVTLDSVLAAIPGHESALTAEIYYRTVDPTSTRATLRNWLSQAGFLGADGKLLPAAVAGTGEFAHAVYLNNYDLGFGRDMHSRKDANGNIYSFVVNYSTLEGAIRKVAPIVTVVMEYSGVTPTDPNKYTKFFTYVDDGSGDSRRVGSMDFDGRGERSTPGNCVACHGGAMPPSIDKFARVCATDGDPACYQWPAKNNDDVDIPNGNLQATFLPWDLDSFHFGNTDPAITQAPVQFDGVALQDKLRTEFGDYSRAAQEAQFKKLNEHTLATYCDPTTVRACATGSARRLVKYWYNDTDLSSNTLLAARYDDSTAPDGWKNNEVVAVSTAIDPAGFKTNPSDTQSLYHDVYARHCRMCHTNATRARFRFDDYQKLAALFAIEVNETVFKAGRMPSTRLTMDRFWTPLPGGATPASLLAAHMSVPSGEAAGPSPLARIAAPVSNALVRNAAARLSAASSVFAQSYAWKVAYAPPAHLAGTPNAQGYQPAVVGAATSAMAFVPEKPGTYTASVVINGGGSTPPAAQQAAIAFAVDDFVPLACNDTAATTAGGAARDIAFLNVDRFAPSGAGITCGSTAGFVTVANAVDVPLTYTFSPPFNAQGVLATANSGTFTRIANAPCTAAAPAGCADDVLRYTPNPNAGAGSYIDTISYTITDADGQTSTASINVSVTADLAADATLVGSPPLSEADAAVQLAVTGGSLPAPGQPRYTVTLLASPTRGVLRLNGAVVAPGAPFTSNGPNLDLVYRSNNYAIGAEQLRFRVVDSVGATRDATLNLSVRPRATFSDVLTQFTSTDGKTDCTTSCHGVGANVAAQAALNLTQARNDIHAQLLGGTVGAVKAVPGSPGASLLLCYPSGGGAACPRSGHFLALPTASASYAVIERWILEGAENN